VDEPLERQQESKDTFERGYLNFQQDASRNRSKTTCSKVQNEALSDLRADENKLSSHQIRLRIVQKIL